MMRFFLAASLMTIFGLVACDMPKPPVKSQVPSHQAEFIMPTSDYPKLLAALDSTAASFHLKRFGAAPGLNELKGREVLYADYKADIKEWRAALDVTDVKAPGKVLLSVYGDYFLDADQRKKFIAAVAAIVQHHGGKLADQTKGTQKQE